MNLREIISEREKKLPKTSRESLPHAVQFSTDNNYYSMYRLGISMAGQPNHDVPEKGPGKDQPTIWMYTDAEEDIVKKAAKNLGIKPKTMVEKGASSEMPDTNTKSPMKPQGPIKRKSR